MMNKEDYVMIAKRIVYMQNLNNMIAGEYQNERYEVEKLLIEKICDDLKFNNYLFDKGKFLSAINKD